MQERDVVAGGFLVVGRDTVALLQPSKQAFDLVPLSGSMLVVLALHPAAFLRRKHRLSSRFLSRFDELFALVPGHLFHSQSFGPDPHPGSPSEPLEGVVLVTQTIEKHSPPSHRPQDPQNRIPIRSIVLRERPRIAHLLRQHPEGLRTHCSSENSHRRMTTPSLRSVSPSAVDPVAPFSDR